MNIQEAVELFKRIDLKVRVVSTGCPKYHRGFIEHNGISLGRICFYKGSYAHTKWYWRQYGELDTSDRPIFLLQYLLETGQVMTYEHYESLVNQATAMPQEDYVSKKAWREANPKFDKAGNKKSRRKLTGRSVRAFLRDLMIQAADDVEGAAQLRP